MKPPHFWSAGLDPHAREAAPLTRALLTPLAMLYGGITARRIKRTQPHKTARPVICVGNLTAGGSGKTPIVRALRTMLSTRGVKAASLSRGHGGRLKGPAQVDPARHSARDVGDEPLMLASDGQAWISRDRITGAQAMIADNVEAIIMDDGHQNPALYKDISLVVVDAAAPFGNGHVIPKGPLREPVKVGLSRADAIVLIGDGPVAGKLAEMDLPVFRAHLTRTTPLPSGPLVAFAGIGRPQRFFDALRQDGADLCDTSSFGDHHVYRDAEIAHLRAIATAHDAKLVTTEKDMARLPVATREGIVSINIEAIFEDPDAIAQLLNTAMAGHCS